MKNMYLCFLGLLLFSGIKAQINYNFTAVAGAYNNLTGGTSPAFTAVTGYAASDEGYANAVPLGFSFNYNGTGYTTINLNSDGFASFGAPFGDDAYYEMDLPFGPTVQTAARPILAPLWDDLDFASSTNITYLTTGSSPNRVFTVQWDQALWDYSAASPVISFQLKLYETTNVIEFIYKQEAGSTTSPAAAIGITATNVGVGNFMSITNASGSSYSTTSAASISAKPATGQVFRFTPLTCNLTFIQLTGISNTSLNFSWSAISGAAGYEYAVTTSSTPPASGTSTGSTTASANSLSVATAYYIHVRTNCGTFSPWTTLAVTTSCNAFTTGYTQNFNAVTTPAIPACFRVQDVNADGTTWITGDGNGTTLPTNNLRYAWNTNNAANDWIFLGPFSLSTGNTYNLSFKYKASNGPTFVEKLEVKYGTSPFASAMTSAAIFSNTNIISAVADPYATTNAPFTVPSNNNYYIGFRVFSDADQAVLHVDDITINGGNLPVALKSFTGERKEGFNLLSWVTVTESNNKGFELERSADGRAFTSLAVIASKAENGNSNLEINYNYADAKTLSGTNYYRLKQIDKDGKFTYSNIVTLKSKISDLNLSSIYPNPAKDNLGLIISSPIAEKISIVITDLTGKIILQQTASMIVGDNEQSINIQKLSSGTYLVKAICANGCETAIHRFVKQ